MFKKTAKDLAMRFKSVDALFAATREDLLEVDEVGDVVADCIFNYFRNQENLEEINKLSKRDREIIIMRYGLFNQEEKTQKEVADLLGISQSYISRIEKKVIRRLKNIVKC